MCNNTMQPLACFFFEESTINLFEAMKFIASVPGFPHSVRVFIRSRMRIMKTRTERGRPGTEATKFAH